MSVSTDTATYSVNQREEVRSQQVLDIFHWSFRRYIYFVNAREGCLISFLIESVKPET